jgi:hypothetical protein
MAKARERGKFLVFLIPPRRLAFAGSGAAAYQSAPVPDCVSLYQPEQVADDLGGRLNDVKGL